MIRPKLVTPTLANGTKLAMSEGAQADAMTLAWLAEALVGIMPNVPGLFVGINVGPRALSHKAILTRETHSNAEISAICRISRTRVLRH
jgi:hypothetical protein